MTVISLYVRLGDVETLQYKNIFLGSTLGDCACCGGRGCWRVMVNETSIAVRERREVSV